MFLATGKARPAAVRAMEAVGLAGEGLVVSSTSPGIFLQGAWMLRWGLAGASGREGGTVVAQPSACPRPLQLVSQAPPPSPPAAGLTAYSRGGALIAGGELPMDVVRAAFEFSAAHDVPVCGFLGETCVTHRMHPELEELHHRWGWVCAVRGL